MRLVVESIQIPLTSARWLILAALFLFTCSVPAQAYRDAQ
jgi:hypothetical protein